MDTMAFLCIDLLKESGLDLNIGHAPLGDDEADNLGVSPKIHGQIEIIFPPCPEI